MVLLTGERPAPFMPVLWVLASLASVILVGKLWGRVTGAYAYAAVSSLPLVWLAYRLEARRYKACPDCCETVRAGARVCRYCRHAFESFGVS
jgi:hypothetical protein